MSNRLTFREGRKVYLRPVLKSDVDLLTRWFNDPVVGKYTRTRGPLQPAAIEERTIGPSKIDRHAFIIVLKGASAEEDIPIGWMNIFDIDFVNGTATTGAGIGEKVHWNKGYGTEAKMLLLDFAFNRLNLRKIYSKTYSFNKRSRRYSEKCGYRLEAILKKHHCCDGRLFDELTLSVYADRWRKLWEKRKRTFLP